MRIGALGGMLALAVLLIITAALTRVIRDALPRSLLADLFAGAGYLLAGSLFLANTASAVPAVLPDLIGADVTTVDDDVLRGWYRITGFTDLLGDFQMAFIALLVGAFSVAALRGRVVPRWVGWFGVAIAAAAALGGMFGSVLWYPIVGIALALRTRAARRTRARESAVGPRDHQPQRSLRET